MKGYGVSPRTGVTAFSSFVYWSDGTTVKSQYGDVFPAYVYDSSSIIYNYIENYRIYLEGLGAKIDDARLIDVLELETLGFSIDDRSCDGASEWVYATSYWTRSAYNTNSVFNVYSDFDFAY